MRRAATLLAVVALTAALASGCATRATATVDPSANLGSLKSLHVVKLAEDGREINALIADKLRVRGYVVTTGPEKPPAVDAYVTYFDRWMWDITMYLLELTITFRDPKTDYPLATGKSFRTSLVRKSPPEMVDEVLGNIFKEAGK